MKSKIDYVPGIINGIIATKHVRVCIRYICLINFIHIFRWVEALTIKSNENENDALVFFLVFFCWLLRRWWFELREWIMWQVWLDAQRNELKCHSNGSERFFHWNAFFRFWPIWRWSLGGSHSNNLCEIVIHVWALPKSNNQPLNRTGHNPALCDAESLINRNDVPFHFAA